MFHVHSDYNLADLRKNHLEVGVMQAHPPVWSESELQRVALKNYPKDFIFPTYAVDFNCKDLRRPSLIDVTIWCPDPTMFKEPHLRKCLSFTALRKPSLSTHCSLSGIHIGRRCGKIYLSHRHSKGKGFEYRLHGLSSSYPSQFVIR